MINNNILQVDTIISENIILKPFTIIFGIVVAICGLIIMICLHPIAIFADNYRYFKLQYFIYKKKQYQIDNFKLKLLSLDVPKDNLSILTKKLLL